MERNRAINLYLGLSRAENRLAFQVLKEFNCMPVIVPTTPLTHPSIEINGSEYSGLPSIRKALSYRLKSEAN